ncbi:MAG: ABC transporter substrate-binding protein [Anaerolineae bacterium]|nr:ABC transporter substrate-binding protein [Anaerolineae bacterium]
MHIRRLITALGAVALIAGSAITATSNTARAQDATTLNIAFIGAGSGTQAEVDRNLYQAAVLAAEQINGDGLTDTDEDRYQLNVKYYTADSNSDVSDALTDIKADGAVAILGPNDADRLDALLNAGSPSVAVLTTVTGSSRSNVFRLTPDDTTMARMIADYLVDQRLYTRIAAVAADTESAQAGIKEFKSQAGSSKIVADLTQASDADDFTEEAQTIRDARAEVVVAWTLDPQMELLLKALRVEGWNGLIVYPALDDGFVARVGAENATNIVGAGAWSINAYDAQSQDFVSDYAARWNGQPSNNAAAYYDAVEMLAAAIRETSSGNSASSIASQLRSLRDFDGVQGIYNNAESDDALLFQAQPDGQFIEAARYVDGDCTTCLNTIVPDTTTETPSDQATITIAVIGTTDGISAATGKSALQAAQLAAREINDRGGVIRNSTRYTLVVKGYNAADSAAVSTAISQAKTDGATIILGPDFNGHILSVLSAASSNSLPELVSATSAQITTSDATDFVLQVRADDTVMAQAAANYLLNERELTSFATFAARTDYGIDTITAVKKSIDDSDDGRVVLSLEHDVDQKDYTQYAQQIKSSGAQAVFVWTTQPAASALLKALGDQGWQGVFVYGYLTPEMAATLTVPNGIEVIAAQTWWSTAGDWASRDFSARYSTRYGTSPTPQSAAYYDAIYLIADGLSKASASASSLRSWLLDVDEFRGVQGIYRPSEYENGEFTRAVILLSVGSDSSGIREIARYDDGTLLAR